MRSALRHHADTYSLLRQGETCWRTAVATRATLLVDSEQYFGALRRSLLQAREQILIAGWDFDSRIRLPPAPDDPLDEAPLQLGDVLGHLARPRPGLQIAHWDYHRLYRADREADTRDDILIADALRAVRWDLSLPVARPFERRTVQ